MWSATELLGHLALSAAGDETCPGWRATETCTDHRPRNPPRAADKCGTENVTFDQAAYCLLINSQNICCLFHGQAMGIHERWPRSDVGEGRCGRAAPAHVVTVVRPPVLGGHFPLSTVRGVEALPDGACLQRVFGAVLPTPADNGIEVAVVTEAPLHIHLRVVLDG